MEVTSPETATLAIWTIARFAALAVLFGAKGVAEGLARGKIVVDMSSINPTVSQKVGAACEELGMPFIAEAEFAARALDVWFPPGPPRRLDGALSIPGLRVGYLAFQTEKEPFSPTNVPPSSANRASSRTRSPRPHS